MPGLVGQDVVFVGRTMEKPIKGQLAGWLSLVVIFATRP